MTAASSSGTGTATTRSRGRRPRVVLLAEQRLVGDAVRVALTSRGLDVITIAWPDGRRPGAQVRRSLAALRPSAGIVFGDLQDADRREHVRALVAAVPLRWVLVVSQHDDVAWGELVTAGATTILPTSISLDDLSVSLTRVIAGGELMPRRTRERVVQDWQRLRDELRRVAVRLDALSPREARVLALLADGLSVKQIAERHGVAEATVRSQVKAVLRKLEVNSQLAAVAVVRESERRSGGGARWEPGDG